MHIDMLTRNRNEKLSVSGLFARPRRSKPNQFVSALPGALSHRGSLPFSVKRVTLCRTIQSQSKREKDWEAHKCSEGEY